MLKIAAKPTATACLPRPAERGEAKNSFELYSEYTATYKFSKENFTLLRRKIPKEFVRLAT